MCVALRSLFVHNEVYARHRFQIPPQDGFKRTVPREFLGIRCRADQSGEWRCVHDRGGCVVRGTASPIAFARFYDSADTTGSDIGAGWRHSDDQSINVLYQPGFASYPGQSGTVSPVYSDPATACSSGFAAIQSQVSSWQGATASYTNSTCVITSPTGATSTLAIYTNTGTAPVSSATEYDVIRRDGQVFRYTVQNGGISNPPGVSLRLAQTSSGFAITDEDDNVESYDANGVLQSITTRAGVVQSLAYDSNGRLSSVTDSFGNTLSFSRNSTGNIATVTANGGGTVQYSYDLDSRLSGITAMDGTSRTYSYGNASFPSALTAENDESLTQLWSWGYDGQGRGTSSQSALGAWATTLTYNSDGTVTTTDALGTCERSALRGSGTSTSRVPSADRSARPVSKGRRRPTTLGASFRAGPTTTGT